MKGEMGFSMLHQFYHLNSKNGVCIRDYLKMLFDEFWLNFVNKISTKVHYLYIIIIFLIVKEEAIYIM